MLYITLNGACDRREIQQAVTSLKDKSVHIRVVNILADTSGIVPMRNEAIFAIIHELFPLLRKIGIRKAAVLRSGNALGQLSLMKILSHVEVAELEEFGDVESAHAWLLKQE